ncbi:MAG TPA: hypothetical protein VJC08_00940 [bacterium]|nr:hypothetical protein [bacterium]
MEIPLTAAYGQPKGLAAQVSRIAKYLFLGEMKKYENAHAYRLIIF